MKISDNNVNMDNIMKYLFIILIVAAFTSCEDWLDVRPRSEIPTNLHFSRESGYKDQLTGIYTRMCSQSMYGRDMTFGLLSVLSQDYDLKPNNLYRYAQEYNYTEISTKNLIDNIWANSYNCIANINTMLEYINKADPDIFSGNNMETYKGEALGLRAFIHLDLLRIFSSSPTSNRNAMAVPYVTVYDKAITPQKTVDETLDLIIRDLLDAMELLKSDVITDHEIEYTQRRNRVVYFNYYAVVATLARAYLYKGDMENALKYAQIIINEGDKESSTLPWVHSSSVETTQESTSDRIFSVECIFYLKINKLDDIVKYYFTASSGSNSLTPSDEKADVIFEKSSNGYGNDYRMLKGFAYDGAEKYFWKYHQYEGGTFNDIMPILRKSEAYYIAAEASKDSNPTYAIEQLNKVRSARNLADFALTDNLSTDEIQDEIAKEYRKEFLGEGQMFYYYKRLNSPNIDGAGITAGEHVYVLPMPEYEIEFGNRK